MWTLPMIYCIDVDGRYVFSVLASKHLDGLRLVASELGLLVPQSLLDAQPQAPGGDHKAICG